MRIPRLSRRTFLQTAMTAAPAMALLPRLGAQSTPSRNPAAVTGREMKADVLIIGGSLGGVAAALAAARMGRRVLLTEETMWIGGQVTTQGIPLDEHPWSERYGRTQSYADFRDGVRDYYRRHYPLTEAARADRYLNPGAGWVSKLCFEPRVGLAVLYEMLAPHLSAGRIVILLRHHPVAATMEGDYARAVTVRDEIHQVERTLTAPYILDATELGDLLELGGIESVIGAESRAETGEPLAVDGPAEPQEQMVFTHVFVLRGPIELKFTQFHPMLGGQLKFCVIWDEQTKRFWATANLAVDGQGAFPWWKEGEERGTVRYASGLGGNDRRFLMLLYGIDGLNWLQAGCVAQAGKISQSFMYARPVIDGDDLAIIARTSIDAPNQHDADHATFHRVKNFRSLALKLTPEPEGN